MQFMVKFVLSENKYLNKADLSVCQYLFKYTEPVLIWSNDTLCVVC